MVLLEEICLSLEAGSGAEDSAISSSGCRPSASHVCSQAFPPPAGVLILDSAAGTGSPC